MADTTQGLGVTDGLQRPAEQRPTAQPVSEALPAADNWLRAPSVHAVSSWVLPLSPGTLNDDDTAHRR